MCVLIRYPTLLYSLVFNVHLIKGKRNAIKILFYQDGFQAGFIPVDDVAFFAPGNKTVVVFNFGNHLEHLKINKPSFKQVLRLLYRTDTNIIYLS